VGYSGDHKGRSGGAPPTPPLRSKHFPGAQGQLAFRGHFDYSLDAKNRLNVPAKFRAAFSGGVVLAKALEPCVAVWTPDAFERHTDAFLSGLNPLSSERRKLTRFFAGGSFDSELDSAGRVTLNPALLAHGEIRKEVVLVGVIDHLQVWDRDKWLSDQDELNAEIVEIAESLGHPS
jgi:MraZ protein